MKAALAYTVRTLCSLEAARMPGFTPRLPLHHRQPLLLCIFNLIAGQWPLAARGVSGHAQAVFARRVSAEKRETKTSRWKKWN